jgi:hypothetical protein
MAKSAKAWKFMTPAKLYIYETLLERLPQDLQAIAPELGQLVEEEHAMVRQRHVPRRRHLAPADQPHLHAPVVRGA